MIDRLFKIDRKDIQTMTSANPRKIHLHFNVTGDVAFWAESVIAAATDATVYPDTAEGQDQFCAECDRILNESEITAYFAPHISPFGTLAGILIHVDTPSGQRLTESLHTPQYNALAAEILNDFLTAGAPGLQNCVRERIQRQFTEYTERRQ